MTRVVVITNHPEDAMEITQIEVRRHRQRDGANDTIGITVALETGENPLDVIDAIDGIIKSRLFSPQPKGTPDASAAPAAPQVEVPLKEQIAALPEFNPIAPQPEAAPVAPQPEAAPVAPVEEGITSEAFNARVAAVGKRPGGAKCVITALSAFGVSKVGALPVERRQEFLTAVNG